MRKPGPTLAVMIGLPSPLAHESEHDEDALDREKDDGGDDDIAAEAIVSIVHNLHRGGPSAVRDLRKFTTALEELCEAFMSRDNQAFEDAAGDACNALHDLISR